MTEHTDVTGQEPAVNPAAGQEPTAPGGQEPTKPTDSGSESKPEGREPDVFDRDYVNQLRQELARTRKARTLAENKAREFEDRDKTELQKAVERAEAAERAATKATGQLLRFRVAAEKGLTGDWADRLRGESQEELEADADRLLEQLKPAGPPTARTSAFDGGVRTTPEKKGTPEQEHNKFLLRAFGRER